MMKQSALTLVTPVIPSKHDELDGILMKMRADHAAGMLGEFEKVGTMHYGRFVLLEGKLSDAQTHLVFSSDYDGEESEHIRLICEVCPGMIDKLYSCCEGYPAPAERNTDSRAKYLRRWAYKDAAFYVGARGRSLKQIKQESELRDHIWEYLRVNNWEGKTAQEAHRIVRQHVLGQPEFSWVKEKISLPVLKWWNFALVFIIIGLALWLSWIAVAAVVVFLLGWLVVLHHVYEKSDKRQDIKPSNIDDSFITNLEGYEDFQNQNQFTQIIPMKGGFMRRLTIHAVLLYGKFRILNEFVKGELMGIPTIHFARWVMLDGGKQVLFFSNFDGSWQQYLGDFIDKSGWGLTAIFSNTENFPKTRYLFWGGAYDEEHFLAWSRYYQIPTHVWYCAYPKLSIKNVNTNSIIRSELIRDLSEQEAQTFLNRF